MAREWTDEQKLVIEQNNSNLLVAAAAGSGKTAVMVERIIKRVLDESKPVDIDRIVVVTFTKAAAKQMKERIAKAFTEILLSEKNEARARRIRAQISLLDNAIITTIDSFCNYILCNYFNSIDLDPVFRIGDDAELTLIKAEVYEEIIEEAYEKKGKAFTDFVEAYTRPKSDSEMEEWIIGMYEMAQSNPFPEEWILSCKDNYNVNNKDEFVDLPITKAVVKHARSILGALLIKHEQLLFNLKQPGGIHEYEATIESDILGLRKACQSENFLDIFDNIDVEFVRLARAPKDAPEELKDYVKGVRDTAKKTIKELKDNFFNVLPELHVEDIRKIKPFADVFVDLVLDFSRKYEERKKKENILSFSDIEHLALKVLVDCENGTCKKSKIAEELASFYEEIYIDEYQDSNMVQEMILNSISRGNNMFMVGDIKQSIYSFRQADPGIFLEKYDAYEENCNAENVLICLHKNFRSRANVLNCVNDIFLRIMKAELGGVEYDKDAMLVCGNNFFEEDQKKQEQGTEGTKPELGDFTTKMLLCDFEQSVAETDDEDEIEVSNNQFMAGAIASQISRLVEEYNIKYSDIVILLRSANKMGPVYANVLNEAGIPAICNTSFGYFSAREVVEVLNILKVIDNPLQDIPLAGALRSFYCYLTAEELAALRLASKGALYNCISAYISNAAENDLLAEKLKKFDAFLQDYRGKAGYLPIHELVKELIYSEGYITYISSTRGAKQKIANLDMLIATAKEYENTSFHGLFSFLRYLDKIQKYEIDMGEADIVSENDNVVRIMSIHKSKGLEFPIVFLGELQKKYNLMSSNNKLSFHSKYGLAMDYVDLNLRVKVKSFFKNAMALGTRLDTVGEELRVLYVALTRAVSKLYLVGGVKKVEETIAGWKEQALWPAETYLDVYKNINYLSLCGPAVCKKGTGDFSLEIIDRVQMSGGLSEEKLNHGSFITNLEAGLEMADKVEENNVFIHEFRKRFAFDYPDIKATVLPGKFSVSELKHAKMEEDDNQAVHLVKPEKTDEPNAGALRGNAYHKVFELLDYDISPDYDSVVSFIDSLVDAGQLSKESADLINPKKFVDFLNCELGIRMKKAALSGQMFRERQFIAGFPAYDIRPEYKNCDELILIQGIIDCYFEENGEIVIVDYKTDKVTRESVKEILTGRYSEQLRLYSEAIEQITGKKVKECILYSVSVSTVVTI